MSLLAMKQEGKQEEVSSVFDQFVLEIENSINEIMTFDENDYETKESYRNQMGHDTLNQHSTSF